MGTGPFLLAVILAAVGLVVAAYAVLVPSDREAWISIITLSAAVAVGGVLAIPALAVKRSVLDSLKVVRRRSWDSLENRAQHSYAVMRAAERNFEAVSHELATLKRELTSAKDLDPRYLKTQRGADSTSTELPDITIEVDDYRASLPVYWLHLRVVNQSATVARDARLKVSQDESEAREWLWSGGEAHVNVSRSAPQRIPIAATSIGHDVRLGAGIVRDRRWYLTWNAHRNVEEDVTGERLRLKVTITWTDGVREQPPQTQCFFLWLPPIGSTEPPEFHETDCAQQAGQVWLHAWPRKGNESAHTRPRSAANVSSHRFVINTTTDMFASWLRENTAHSRSAVGSRGRFSFGRATFASPPTRVTIDATYIVTRDDADVVEQPPFEVIEFRLTPLGTERLQVESCGKQPFAADYYGELLARIRATWPESGDDAVTPATVAR